MNTMNNIHPPWLVSLVWMNAEQPADALEVLGVVVEEVPEELGETETDDQEVELQNPDPELFQTQDFE